MRLLPIVVFSLLSLGSHANSNEGKENKYLDNINANWILIGERENSSNDDMVLALFRNSFELLEHNQDLNGCDKCKTRLALGKILALNNPRLVPSVFMEWCLRKGNNEVDCRERFNSKQMSHINTGSSDFSNLLALMSPFTSDGDWFCYYHDDECTSRPEVPEVESLMKSWYERKPVDKYFPPESLGFDTFHILQLSDFDYQIDYLIGAESNCSQELCCIHCGFNEKKAPIDWGIGGRQSVGKYQLSYYNSSYDSEKKFHKGPFVDVSLPSYRGTWDPAHEFGSYHCGSPELLINSTLRAASKLHCSEDIDFDFQFVLFNGGLQVRSNNFEETVNSEVKMLQNMKHYFKKISIIPTLGKHDTYPDSQMAPYLTSKAGEFSWNDELYGDLLLSNGWINNTQFRTIKTHNGAFSITTEFGLKIISLNSNFYNADNYYTFANITNIDNFGQILFLVDELVGSERSDQRVWILSSLPLISDKTLPFQLKVLKTIIKRFSPATIAEIFFGDTHQEGYNIMYGEDEENDFEPEPIAGAWIAPSVSPLHGRNPSFRYFEIDSKTFNVINAYTYYTPLDRTFENAGDELQWSLLYSTREEYTHDDSNHFWPQVLPLNATFWDKVLKKKISDNLKYKQFYQNNKFKLSPSTPNCSNESNYAKCELSYCEILSFTYDEYKACVEERFPALSGEAF